MSSDRRRQTHTRSKRGCFACKQRHMRCDESQPICVKCLIGKRECVYPPPALAYGEQRRQQRGQVSILLWQVPVSAPLDPFDSLPVKMCSQSRELFHYFTRANYQVNPTRPRPGIPVDISSLAMKFKPKNPLGDCIVLNTQDPIGLGSMLLLAGLHFKLMTGGSHSLEHEFLLQKGRAISRVNEWLGDGTRQTPLAFMKMIATLSILESCVGNLVAAEAHLDGLLTIFEICESEKHLRGTHQENDNAEVAQRMLLLAHHFVGAMRSPIVTNRTSPIHRTEINKPGSPGGVADKLAALRLMPFYFPTITSLKTDVVDGSTVMVCLRGMTAAVATQNKTGSSHCACYGDDSLDCLACRSFGGLFLALTLTHAQSISQNHDDEETRFLCSWSSLAIAGNFYLNAVLGLWNAGQLIKPRLFRRLVSILKADLERSEERMFKRAEGRELWFWQAFVAGFILRSSCEKSLDPFLFHRDIRSFSLVTGIVSWDDAKRALQQTVWPDSLLGEAMARRLWTEAVSG